MDLLTIVQTLCGKLGHEWVKYKPIPSRNPFLLEDRCRICDKLWEDQWTKPNRKSHAG